MAQSLFRSIRHKLLNEGKLLRYLAYAVGEVVLIIVGIMLALQLNNWNENRLIRIDEAEGISHILGEVERDIAALETRLMYLEQKDDSLLRIKRAIVEGEVFNSKSILEDVITGSQFGWSQGSAFRSTYDGLIGSGNLGIIKNAEIRNKISDYYNHFQAQTDRIDERETDYPNLTNQLVPRNAGPRGHWEPESIITEKQADDLFRHILDTLKSDQVTAEINFGRFTHTISSGILQRAQELKEILKAYHTEIQE